MNRDRPFVKKRGSTASSFAEFSANNKGRSGGRNRDDSRGSDSGRFSRDSRPPRDGGYNRDSRPSRDGGSRFSRDDRSSSRDGPRSFNRDSRPPREEGGRFNRDSRPSRDGGSRFNRDDRPANRDAPRRFNRDAPKRDYEIRNNSTDRKPRNFERNTDRSGNQGFERRKSFNQEGPKRTFGKKEVTEFRLQGIFEYGNDFCTPNAVPGQSVYGERFCKDAKGVEYRIWDPKRSKLGAALKKGVSQIGIKPGSTVLYLGCSTGTTVSHVGEIVGVEGKVYALDVAPRVLRDLLFTTQKRTNIYPLMADANKPSTFSHAVPKVDVIFMDIAQKDQVKIFLKNIHTFLKPGGFGMLSLKSRSVDITKRPVQVFKESRAMLEEETTIVDYKELDPYEIDHAFFVVKKKAPKDNLSDELKPELN